MDSLQIVKVTRLSPTTPSNTIETARSSSSAMWPHAPLASVASFTKECLLWRSRWELENEQCLAHRSLTIRWADSFSHVAKYVGTLQENIAMMRLCVCVYYNMKQKESNTLLVHVLSTSKHRSWYPHRQGKTCQLRRSSEGRSIHTVKSSRSRKTNFLRQCHAQRLEPNQQLSLVIPISCSEIVRA